MQKYYLGVDGGGTKCRMRLADAQLNILSEATTNSPSNLQVRDGDAAYSAILELTEIVFAEAGLTQNDIANTSACFGMAGGRLQSACDALAAREFPFAAVKVYDDIDIARAGAHAGDDGAVLIIGTGSAGMGIMDGQRHQIGGWGFLVGDTMAGAILGRELLRKSLLAHDGLEPKSELTEAIMAEFDNSPDQLMDWSFNNPAATTEMLELQGEGLGELPSDPVPARPADYGRFVPLFFDYYEKNDPVAVQLMAFELNSIDQYVHWFLSKGAKSIAIVGGLGTRLMPLLTERYGDVIVAPKSEPLQGAVILARQLFADA